MYNLQRTWTNFSILSKTLRTISNTKVTNITKPEEPFSNAVKEAERVVGYPTSFLSLRWILNDEIANIVHHISRLIGTNHPFLKTAKNLLLRNDNASWGLIVLLISKVAGLNSKFSELECDTTADILHSQRIIAEVTQMIKTSHIIHKSLINIEPSDDNASDLFYGNKLALLCGDYLLSTSFMEISKLKNFQVQETMSTSLRDLAESQFLGIRDCQNRSIPSKPLPVQKQVTFKFGETPFKLKHVLGNMKAEWVLRNILGGGTLLGKACQSSLILADHKSQVQELAYIFGRSLALAYQASMEKTVLEEETFSLVCAPVMFHLEYDPKLYVEIAKGVSGENNVNFDLIRKTVLAGPGLEKTSEIQDEFSRAALGVLDNFADSNSKTALKNIIQTL